MIYWHAIQSSSKTDYLDRNIFIQGGTLDGGDDVIDASADNQYTGSCYDGNVILYSGGGCIKGTGRPSADKKQNWLRIYPNPVRERLTVAIDQNQYNLDHAQLKIFNSMGSLMKTVKVMQEKTIINLEKLPPGPYFIRIKLKNEILKKKMIKL